MQLCINNKKRKVSHLLYKVYSIHIGLPKGGRTVSEVALRAVSYQEVTQSVSIKF